MFISSFRAFIRATTHGCPIDHSPAVSPFGSIRATVVVAPYRASCSASCVVGSIVNVITVFFIESRAGVQPANRARRTAALALRSQRFFSRQALMSEAHLRASLTLGPGP